MTSYVPSAPAPHLFINYRNDDEPFGAVLVDHALSARFGEDRVFRASRSIAPGDDFAESILHAVRHASAVLAVIGRRWLRATDEHGRRRLDRPDDWVRRELREALRGGVRVVPVLLDAHLPAPAELPRDIARLARCQYLRLHHRHSPHDLDRLVNQVAALVPDPPAASNGGTATGRRRSPHRGNAEHDRGHHGDGEARGDAEQRRARHLPSASS